MTNPTDQEFCNIQNRILEITVGCTTTVRGVAVTRWAKDVFEVDTWGRSDGVGSEHAVEQILAHRE